MRRSEPIIIVEDDTDDQELLKEIFHELKIPNILRFFNSCAHAFDFLVSTIEKPLLIISDINLPAMNGLEFCKKISETEHLNRKRIPFVFLTTTQDTKLVAQAYSMLIQGFFVKPASIAELRHVISTIVGYWSLSYRL